MLFTETLGDCTNLKSITRLNILIHPHLAVFAAKKFLNHLVTPLDTQYICVIYFIIGILYIQMNSFSPIVNRCLSPLTSSQLAAQLFYPWQLVPFSLRKHRVPTAKATSFISTRRGIMTPLKIHNHSSLYTIQREERER